MESNIPEEMVQEILLRSPVKSLLRFKCVCKQWLSLISDPSFAKSHFELSAAPSHRLLFPISYSDSEAQSIDVDVPFHDESAVVSLIHPLPKFDVSCCIFEVFGSCRGFVLFSVFSSNLYVWNPSNGVHRPLSLSFSHLIRKIRKSNIYTLLIGFGHDPSTDDYLVVVVSQNEEGNHMMLFSLKTNSWKKIQLSHIPHTGYYKLHGLFINGAIHWLIFPHHGSDPGVIIVFDLTEKQLSAISLPDGDFKFGYLSGRDLIITGGCLSFWEPRLVCSTKGGELVALNDANLMKFNDKGELLEIHRKYDRLDWFRASFLYRESTLSIHALCNIDLISSQCYSNVCSSFLPITSKRKKKELRNIYL
ncbi:F-box/kelch-repeat protein At3g06240-like, partial [Gastrolobium bilobum]|uniref:F-box/kelch-repeat protein At3g06240-like n=1 Tax=Gastrolobium bilobum TaxID=150636 RepID=UPI002AAFD445